MFGRSESLWERKPERMDKKEGDGFQKTAYLGMFTAMAMILSYVESLFPVFAGVPGMKLGLPNVATVSILYLYSWKEALAVSAVRIAATSLLFGSVFSFWFSLAGGIASLLVMALLKKSGVFGKVGVSLAGGVTHNAAQLAVAAYLVKNTGVWYYFFVLAFTGALTGVLIGLLASAVVRRLGR